MKEIDLPKLSALRSRLIEAQTELLLRAAEASGLPSSNELRKIADVDLPPDRLSRPTRHRVAHRHPFEIGLHRCGLARRPVAFCFDLMVLRARAVRVIGALMVVPRAEPRRDRMRRLRSPSLRVSATLIARATSSTQ